MLSPPLPLASEGRWHTLPEDFTEICWQQKHAEKRMIWPCLLREYDLQVLFFSDKLDPAWFIPSGLPLPISCLFLCYDSLLRHISSLLNCPRSSLLFLGLLPQFPCGTWLSLTSLGFSLLSISLDSAVSSSQSHFWQFLYLLSLSLVKNIAHIRLQLMLSIPRRCSDTTTQSCIDLAWQRAQAWVENRWNPAYQLSIGTNSILKIRVYLMTSGAIIQIYKQFRTFKVF